MKSNELRSTSVMKTINSSVRSIVAGYDDGALRIFDLVHEQMALKLQAHTSSITAVHIPYHSSYSIAKKSTVLQNVLCYLSFQAILVYLVHRMVQ